MKKLLMVSLFALVYAFSLQAQEQDSSAMQEMMQAWQEYMTPGPQHEMLAKSVGTWKAEITTWMDPAAPPSKSEGTSTYDTLLGGRYLQGKHSAEMGGMLMNGFELTGYDNAKKKFFSVWIDNGGTGILYQEGTYDEAAKTLSLSGTTTDPSGKDMKVRQTIKSLDDNTSFMEMYMIQDGKETKWMEMKSTRVK